jgi:hypothetical protein
MTLDSLPAKLFLLACDAEKHRRQRGVELGYALRGAILADLNLRQCLRVDEDGYAKASSARRTGDRVLDDALHEIAESRPRRLRAWVRHGARASVGAVQDQLVAAGEIRVGEDAVLGIFKVRRIDVVHPTELAALRARVRDVVLINRSVNAVPVADAALVSLAIAGEVRGTLDRRERRAHADRITALSKRGGEAVPALRDVMRQVKAARAAAAAAASGS